MSDPQQDMLRMLYANETRLAQTETKEVPRLNYGAANPSSWPVDLPFFRTDLGWWVVSDGVRFLTAFEYAMVLTAFVSYGTASPQTTNLQNVRFDDAPYVTRVTFHSRVSTTNNGSNFWSFAIQGINGAVTLSDTIATTDTSASAAGAIVRVDGPPSTAVPTNRDWFRVQLSKTGAPGAVELAAQMNYRLIVP